MEISDLVKKALFFRDERNWKQFHTPKNLLISLGAEMGELMECFQWKSDEEIMEMINSDSLDAVGDEIADVGIYLFDLCDSLGLDFEEVILKKLEKNEEKYPISKCFGIAKKYTEL